MMMALWLCWLYVECEVSSGLDQVNISGVACLWSYDNLQNPYKCKGAGNFMEILSKKFALCLARCHYHYHYYYRYNNNRHYPLMDIINGRRSRDALPYCCGWLSVGFGSHRSGNICILILVSVWGPILSLFKLSSTIFNNLQSSTDDSNRMRTRKGLQISTLNILSVSLDTYHMDGGECEGMTEAQAKIYSCKCVRKEQIKPEKLLGYFKNR